jgi:hypothetical protein
MKRAKKVIWEKGNRDTHEIKEGRKERNKVVKITEIQRSFHRGPKPL